MRVHECVLCVNPYWCLWGRVTEVRLQGLRMPLGKPLIGIHVLVAVFTPINEYRMSEIILLLLIVSFSKLCNCFK